MSSCRPRPTARTSAATSRRGLVPRSIGTTKGRCRRVPGPNSLTRFEESMHSAGYGRHRRPARRSLLATTMLLACAGFSPGAADPDAPRIGPVSPPPPASTVSPAIERFVKASGRDVPTASGRAAFVPAIPPVQPSSAPPRRVEAQSTDDRGIRDLPPALTVPPLTGHGASTDGRRPIVASPLAFDMTLKPAPWSRPTCGSRSTWRRPCGSPTPAPWWSPRRRPASGSPRPS